MRNTIAPPNDADYTASPGECKRCLQVFFGWGWLWVAKRVAWTFLAPRGYHHRRLYRENVRVAPSQET